MPRGGGLLGVASVLLAAALLLTRESMLKPPLLAVAFGAHQSGSTIRHRRVLLNASTDMLARRAAAPEAARDDEAVSSRQDLRPATVAKGGDAAIGGDSYPSPPPSTAASPSGPVSPTPSASDAPAGVLASATPPSTHSVRLPRATATITSATHAVCGTEAASAPLAGRIDFTTPPYYHPTTCAVWPRTAEQSQACLSGRNVYVLGNSVARAYVYQLQALLGEGRPADRRAQKQACVKGTPGHPPHAESCTLTFGSYLTARFLWRQFLGGMPANFTADGEGDLCEGVDAETCYAAFFRDSKAGDILVITQVGGLVVATE